MLSYNVQVDSSAESREEALGQKYTISPLQADLQTNKQTNQLLFILFYIIQMITSRVPLAAWTNTALLMQTTDIKLRSEGAALH